MDFPFSSLLINKKTILKIAVPSASSIGIFGGTGSTVEYKIMVNYNGQADLLLSLQIPPDYYPYQFKKTNLYDYLTNVNKYIVVNNHVSDEKKKIKESLQSRINTLLSKVKEFGSSLWNEDLYDTGIVFRNNQFWNNKKTTLLFIEQFIADDYTNIEDGYDLLPVHKKLIVTNYRAARDPYTIFKEEVFNCFKNKGSSGAGNGNNCNSNNLAKKFMEYMANYNLEEINSIYRFGKYIEFWNRLIEENKEQMKTLGFEEWITKEKLFSLDDKVDKVLAKKYETTIFTKEELCLLHTWADDSNGNAKCDTPSDWKTSIDKDKFKIGYKPFTASKPSKTHHPALEQQILPGTAPLAEGSQKDIIVFLYQFAASIDKYAKSSEFKSEFASDHRKDAMTNVLNNVAEIAANIKTRISKIRDYFKAIGVVDSSFNPEGNNPSWTTTNSKTFTVLTYPPSAFGAGEATIQSMSKFPFIYKDIGLRQPIPANLLTTATASKVHEDHDEDDLSHEIFSVDDNGWWWKIGSAHLDPTNLLEFRGQSDTILILANEDDWNLLKDPNSGTLKAASSLLASNKAKGSDSANFEEIDIRKVQGNEPELRNNKGYHVSYNKYHLWNEGLRSPIALNLLLDNLVDIFQRQYDTEFKGTNNGSAGTGSSSGSANNVNSKYQEAMDWGSYWHEHFINGTHKTTTSSGNQK
ncbi:iron ABC transporter substrate-binding protein [Candidatus Mycoplasma haematohominis]|uniref:iron ABC transporter substrate-binding protein n=1 Tax=Candidatus Mycoplasma haematohominis TaxID=1494318 RepID=UPI001C0A703D|nr:iron ABC transporter substrate-binding protein [Candidatus Mycoplasma haemohominis]